MHELCRFDVIFHSDESSCCSLHRLRCLPASGKQRIQVRHFCGRGPSARQEVSLPPTVVDSVMSEVSGRGIRSSAETRAAMSFFDTSGGQSCLF